MVEREAVCLLQGNFFFRPRMWLKNGNSARVLIEGGGNGLRCDYDLDEIYKNFIKNSLTTNEILYY